jgi:hypothetical protein
MSSLKGNKNEFKKRYQNYLGADNHSFRNNNPNRQKQNRDIKLSQYKLC